MLRIAERASTSPRKRGEVLPRHGAGYANSASEKSTESLSSPARKNIPLPF
jgi:hypothetical protein